MLGREYGAMDVGPVGLLINGSKLLLAAGDGGGSLRALEYARK